VIVGADFGNATTTVVAHGPQPRAAFFPSFVARLGVAAYEGLSKIATTRHHISYGGKHAIVGEDALEGMGADTLLAELDQADAWKRYVNDQTFYCFLAGVSATFLDADAIGVRLATGAPLSIYEAHGEAIRRRYVGEHRYTYNGHTRTVIVEDVQIYGEGREVLRLLPPAERRGRVAVHDLGGRTWNVLLFKDGALLGARTFDFGIDRLFAKVKAMPGDVGARWQMQREMRRSPKAHAKARAELDALLAAALDDIEQKVRIDKAERHLLVGGGAVYLPPVLGRRYKEAPATVINGDAPEAANALAYALAAAEVA
jgi:hypothetical protein